MRRSVLVLSIVVGLVAPVGLGPATAAPCNEGPVLTAAGALPVTTAKCTGLQPGQQVSSSVGSCTLNFLFTGSDGNRYMGVAGHCVLPEDAADKTWAYGSGPVATSGGQRIGEWVYAVLDYDRDFSLIRLDPGVAASGDILHFGGPTGLYTDHRADTLGAAPLRADLDDRLADAGALDAGGEHARHAPRLSGRRRRVG